MLHYSQGHPALHHKAGAAADLSGGGVSPAPQRLFRDQQQLQQQQQHHSGPKCPDPERRGPEMCADGPTAAQIQCLCSVRRGRHRSCHRDHE